ncbi:MAG: hypothetical protein GY822_22975 [Deltaproteobacteria bacterium]|nr:hypothetical protein [Deltaproteobacteria bacterium]
MLATGNWIRVWKRITDDNGVRSMVDEFLSALSVAMRRQLAPKDISPFLILTSRLRVQSLENSRGW